MFVRRFENVGLYLFMNVLRFCSSVLVLLISVLFTPTNGWSQATNNEVHHPKSLIVLPFASKVHFRSVAGTTQLTYTLSAAYPADDELGMISKELRRNGWTPLKYDFLNPNIPSSHVRGWQQFEDHATQPYTTVKQWLSWWADSKHDLVSYSFEYRYPVNGPIDLQMVRVFATFVPAQIAEKEKGTIAK